MTGLRDIFSNAFNGSGGIDNNNFYPNNNFGNRQRNGEGGMATNLKESNTGIARQSNLVDEIIALKQQQRQPHMDHRNFFPSNPANENINKQQAILTDEIVSDLSRRVNNLSMMERQQAQSDMHGFRLRNRNEDPWELSIWMNDMDDVIRKGISGNDKRFSALQLAMHTQGDNNKNGSSNNRGLGTTMSGAEYIKSQKLKFLRASDWVVEDAVARMALFFELKLEHFGSESLIRDLTMKDLTPTDLQLWKQYGFLQLSEERDAYGRAIMVLLGKQQFHLPIDTVTRCILYLSMIMTRDETLQLSGHTLIFWGIGQEFTINTRARRITQVFKAIPIRGVSRHICYDSKGMQEIFSVIAQVIQVYGVIRLKLHSGTSMECFYNLLTYGIPRNAIPINNEGQVELDFHHSFLEAIERKEADDQKRRRQERLDRQIQQLQLQNQMPYSNGIDSSQNGQGITERRGEPYQREPPIMTMDEEDMPGLDPFLFQDMDGVPDDFMKRFADINSSPNPSGTNSRTETSSSTTLAAQPRQKPSQSKTVPSTTSMQTAAANNTGLSVPEKTEHKKDEFIVVPGVYDVIMGRGRHNKKKPGNRKLNALLESYQSEYEASDKFQKTVLSEVVVSKMIEDGSRFLVREGEKKHGMWIEVSLEKARDKVAHDFRNLRRNAKIAQKSSTTVADSSMSSAAGSAAANEFGNPKRQRSLVNVMEEQNDSKSRKASNMMM